MIIEPNNNTIQVTREYTEKTDPDNKTFAEFIREKRKFFNDEYGQELNTSDIARIVGITPEMFRKILNQNKPTKKRDLIIAICIVLRMFPGEIDEALFLYGMHTLNEKDSRDKAILDQVSSKEYSITLNQLNNHLIKCGYKGLDIHNYRNRKSKSASIKPIPLCEELKIQIRTPIDFEHYYGDRYNSLSTRYNPSGIRITGEMLLLDKENQSLLRKINNENNNHLAEIWNLSKTTISLFEYGMRIPNIATMEVISKYYDITIDMLIHSEPSELRRFIEKRRTPNPVARLIKRMHSFRIISQQYL